VHPDFQQINKCAYFDYQRDRVYVRSSPRLKRLKARRTRRIVQSRRLRLNARVRIEPSHCPRCDGTDIAVAPLGKKINCVRPRRKRAFDLVYTPAGIRRRVIECKTSAYECFTCSHSFVPELHERLDTYFHGLKSWVMYQHVGHCISLGSIKRMCEDFFGLRINVAYLHMMKGLLGRYYRRTVEVILRDMLVGNVLHVDETEVKLRDKPGIGYVWVFASLEEVVFMYRPTREGNFVKEVLKEFRGVLVSDFYSAYDSLSCPQQKCLVHLIRDMNQDLLNNPFDEVLQKMTRAFGSLLRAIVSTVDQHGLKRVHLRRHEGQVSRFCDDLSGQPCASDSAEALRTRLLRYRDKLFTFLRHDGVPWNNNNGEHALRQFAYFREHADGLMTETGLNSYLTLLSIAETCRYRGVSFLRFLASREVDIGGFCDAKRTKNGQPIIEVYPEGFVAHRSRDEKRLGRFNQKVRGASGADGKN
jgi:hypothetical protein